MLVSTVRECRSEEVLHITGDLRLEASSITQSVRDVMHRYHCWTLVMYGFRTCCFDLSVGCREVIEAFHR